MRSPVIEWPRVEDEELRYEALDGLVCLNDPKKVHPDPAQRDRAFIEWLKRSPMHQLSFREVIDTERTICQIDAALLAGISRILKSVVH